METNFLTLRFVSSRSIVKSKAQVGASEVRWAIILGTSVPATTPSKKKIPSQYLFVLVRQYIQLCVFICPNCEPDISSSPFTCYGHFGCNFRSRKILCLLICLCHAVYFPQNQQVATTVSNFPDHVDKFSDLVYLTTVMLLIKIITSNIGLGEEVYSCRCSSARRRMGSRSSAGSMRENEREIDRTG